MRKLNQKNIENCLKFLQTVYSKGGITNEGGISKVVKSFNLPSATMTVLLSNGILAKKSIPGVKRGYLYSWNLDIVPNITTATKTIEEVTSYRRAKNLKWKEKSKRNTAEFQKIEAEQLNSFGEKLEVKPEEKSEVIVTGTGGMLVERGKLSTTGFSIKMLIIDLIKESSDMKSEFDLKIQAKLQRYKVSEKILDTLFLFDIISKDIIDNEIYYLSNITEEDINDSLIEEIEHKYARLQSLNSINEEIQDSKNQFNKIESVIGKLKDNSSYGEIARFLELSIEDVRLHHLNFLDKKL